VALRVALLAAVAAVAGGVACGWTPADEQTLTKYFEYSGLYDTTRASQVADVVFDPRVEGVVQRFRVVSRMDEALGGERLRRALRLEAIVQSSSGIVERPLLVTMERAADGRWRVLAFTWA
jgi:hypothetical protein